MRIGLVVDSPCDLPVDFIENNRIMVLPTTVEVGDTKLVDYRNEQVTLQFLESHIATRGIDGESTPFSIVQVRDLFLSRLVIDYDYVFCLTLTRTRSAIFDNATQASFGILNDYRPIRAAAGHQTPFSLRVIDTQNMFAGQGVTAIEAAQMIAAGEQPPKIRARLEYLIQHTHGYLVPRDLHYMRARTRKRGDTSISLMSATLGTALDIKPIAHCNRGNTEPVAKIRGFDEASRKLLLHAADRVRSGLLSPNICLSYGGELAEMRALPGYQSLKDTCIEHHVTLHESVTSLTAMMNVGKGVLIIGFAAEGQTFKG
jgi:DegV family protein with EDD domain